MNNIPSLEEDNALRLVLKFDKKLKALLKHIQNETADIDLFAPPPPTEDCPLCCIPMPRASCDRAFFACCGVTICCGCDEKKTLDSLVKHMKKHCRNAKHVQTCAFCRQPTVEGVENEIKALEELIEKERDPESLNQLAIQYVKGEGVEQDPEKELELRIQAAEMGHEHCIGVIGLLYRTTWRVAFQPYFRAFLEVAAKKGSITHREYLAKWGDLPFEIAIKHWMVGAKAGSQKSLDEVMKYKNGKLEKEELSNVLREFQASNDIVKSHDRDVYTKRYDGKGRNDHESDDFQEESRDERKSEGRKKKSKRNNKKKKGKAGRRNN